MAEDCVSGTLDNYPFDQQVDCAIDLKYNNNSKIKTNIEFFVRIEVNDTIRYIYIVWE